MDFARQHLCCCGQFGQTTSKKVDFRPLLIFRYKINGQQKNLKIENNISLARTIFSKVKCVDQQIYFGVAL